MPLKMIFPETIGTRPIMLRRVVVLPAPFKPTRQTISPSSISRDSSLRTRTFAMFTCLSTPYSPDLNPIENVWKSVKRVISEKSPLNVEELKEAIAKAFKKLTESISFAKSWIEKFLGDKFKMLCT